MTSDVLERTFPMEVRAAIAKYPPGRERSAALWLLYLAQAAYGRLTEEAVGEVAGLLDMSRTDVRGLVGFYSLFYERPHGGFVLHWCTDLPCVLRGAEELLARLVEKLGIRPGETTADGVFTLETVKCLAACDRAPVMQVNLEYVLDLTDERLDELLAELRSLAATDPPRRPPFGFGPPSEMRARATGSRRGGGDA